jgi:uncharacterized membrane protein YfcA
MLEYLVLLLVALTASFTQSAVGFGFAIVSSPLLSLVFPIRTTMALVLLLILGFTVQMAFRFRRDIPIRVIAVPLLAAVVGRSLGVILLMSLETGVFRLIWGVVLILFSLYFGYYRDRIRIRAGTRNGLIAGLLSGVLGGMFNTGGPPAVLYYYYAIPDKRQYMAALQITFLTGSLVNLVMHLGYGNINLEVLKLAGLGYLALIAGTIIGLRVFKRLNRKQLGVVVYALTFVMGILQIVKAIS